MTDRRELPLSPVARDSKGEKREGRKSVSRPSDDFDFVLPLITSEGGNGQKVLYSRLLKEERLKSRDILSTLKVMARISSSFTLLKIEKLPMKLQEKYDGDQIRRHFNWYWSETSRESLEKKN